MWSEGGAGLAIRAEARAAVAQGLSRQGGDSMDQPYRALVDLQGGGRLVCIIPHAPEVIKRHETRLEVVPGHGGSTVRFLL